ncbi:MAG: hypothetical protein R3D33_00520 [Hyphomicrobiaceae bacterium]
MSARGGAHRCARLLGLELDKGQNAAELARALGGLCADHEGRAAFDDPPRRCRRNMPPSSRSSRARCTGDGVAFNRRRWRLELATTGRAASPASRRKLRIGLARPGASRSLCDGRVLAAVKLHPDASAVDGADLNQLRIIPQIHKEEPAIDTVEVVVLRSRRASRGARLQSRGQGR